MKRSLSHLGIFISAFAASSTFANKSKHAHEHGHAKMSIAVEGKDKEGKVKNEISIDFDSPAEALLGFEHEAKTDKEKKTWEDVQAKLKDPFTSFIKVDPALQCTVKESKIEREEAEHHDNHGKGKKKKAEHHSDIEVSYTLTCTQDPTGKSAEIILGQTFPKKFKSIKVQVDSVKPSSTTLKNGQGKINL